MPYSCESCKNVLASDMQEIVEKFGAGEGVQLATICDLIKGKGQQQQRRGSL